MGEQSSRARAVVAIVLVAVLVGVGAGLVGRPSSTVSSAVSSAGTFSPVAMVAVHVGGWVVSPGVVSLAEGSMVADAIAAAGGMRPGASGDAINLAAPVSDGGQVIVPGPGGSDQVGSSAASDGLIALNTATAAELQELPGVGPVLAERIVSHRESSGRFETVEDLLEVPGIGEAKLSAIRDLVRP